MIRRVAVISMLLTLACCDGCDKSSQARPVTRAMAQAAPEGHGVVRGSVTFVGSAPTFPQIVATDKCCEGEPALHDETVVVNPNGTLRNTFVYLEDGPAVDGASRPAALLDQQHCRYVPHVLGIQVNQALRIRSSDPTMHNVHFNPNVNVARNFAMTQAGQETSTTFAAPEFIKFKCDVHPWMTAWVGVFDHPYFALTQDDGRFEIKNIPPGTYKLVAWHELFGRQEQTVTVGASPVDAQFAFGKQQG
jgi:plastocyanin